MVICVSLSEISNIKFNIKSMSDEKCVDELTGADFLEIYDLFDNFLFCHIIIIILFSLTIIFDCYWIKKFILNKNK